MQHSTTIPTRGATIALQAETALLWLILRRLLGAALLLTALGADLLPWPIELWAVVMRLGAVVGCVVLAVPLLDPVHDIAGEDFLLDLRAGQLLYRRHLHSGHVRVLRRVPLGLVGILRWIMAIAAFWICRAKASCAVRCAMGQLRPHSPGAQACNWQRWPKPGKVWQFNGKTCSFSNRLCGFLCN